MPFHNPPSEDREDSRSKGSSGLQSLVQAEKLMQIAFVLPCAMVIGWGAGWWVDHHFHSHWATITGIILGIAAGMLSAIRMALAAGNTKPKSGR